MGTVHNYPNPEAVAVCAVILIWAWARVQRVRKAIKVYKRVTGSDSILDWLK